jgi:hypothetical protein
MEVSIELNEAEGGRRRCRVGNLFLYEYGIGDNCDRPGHPYSENYSVIG